MRAANGNVFVTVEKITEDRTGTGLYKDIRFHKHHKVAISGKVIAVPQMGNHEVLYEEFEGFPARKTRLARFHRATEFPCLGQVGDKAYFHYLSLEATLNHIMTADGKIIYRIPLSDIFCWVRDGEVIMNFNWVFAVPWWGGDEYKEIEGVHNNVLVKIKGKIKSILGEDVVTEIKVKPEVDMAVIKYIGPGIYEQREGIIKEDLTFLTPSCQFENTIEGQSYWTFKHEDIIAIKRGERIFPVADYALIQTDRSLHPGKVLVDPVHLPSAFTGIFVEGGDKVQGYNRGDKIYFTKQGSRVMMSNLLLMKEGNILGEVQ